MPWREVNEMEQREEFIRRAMLRKANVAELCREFGISYTLGKKLVSRFRNEGFKGIAARSRRPTTSPDQTEEWVIAEIVKLRCKHPAWGGLTLKEVLEAKFGKRGIPSARTIDRILVRYGLVQRRRHRRRSNPYSGNLVVPRHSNHVWTADFKGWWRTRSGKIVFPLTIRDAYSRYILDIAALSGTNFEATKERFQACFAHYGKPDYIRTDNGGPFAATRAVGGLSRLSAWWVKLGIFPERIDLASPYQNGAHERMHKDMKKELQKNPAYNLQEEQKRFEDWVDDYNNIRPHHSLGMKVPSAVYSPSSRNYDPQEPQYSYPLEMETRKVSCRGCIFWHSQKKFISSALVHERVGICEESDNVRSVWYCDFPLGYTNAAFDTPLGGYHAENHG